MSRKRPAKKQSKIETFEPVAKSSSKPSNNFHIEFLNQSQRDAWNVIDNNDITFIIGPAGSAKSFLSTAYAVKSVLSKTHRRIILSRPVVEAGGEKIGYIPGPQPLTAKIATPNGWVNMGELKVGDKVIGRDGLPAEVLGIYPKGEKDVYKVTTFDGTTTTCCIDHLWYTQTKDEKKANKQGSVRTTGKIISDLENGIKHFIPRNEPVHFDKKDLLIAPYTLGVLLGDGHVNATHVRFASADEEIVSRVNSEIKSLGLHCKKAKKQYSKAWSYTISSTDGHREKSRPVRITELATQKVFNFSGNKQAQEFVGCNPKTLSTRVFYGVTVDGFKYEKCGDPWKNPVLDYLRKYELNDKKAWDKFIPDDYKYSSIQDRIDILRGLLDTDGSCRIRKADQVTFYTTSCRLANDVAEIVRSLGGKARIGSRDRRNEEGRAFAARRISYEVAISIPDNINPFYLNRKAERFVGKNVSHIEIISVEKVGFEKVQCIKVDNSEHLYLTDNFIVTHNTFEEKLHPYLLPIYDNLDEMVGKTGFQRELINKSMEVAPIAFLRGRSFHEAICILDEAQNITYEQMVLYLTRIGRKGKLIINGDPMQSDLRVTCLMEIIKKLEGIPGIGVVRLDNTAIVRNPIISQILERL